MADMRYYDSSKKALEYIEGANGAVKAQLATSDGAAAGTEANPIAVSIGGASVSLTAPTSDTVTNVPVTGVKTVVATAAEVFAGSSVLASRKQLGIRNDDPVNRIRVGPSGVTQQNGFPVEPGGAVEFRFEAATVRAVFAISEGAAVQVEVWEA